MGVGLVFVYQGHGFLLGSVRVQDLVKPGVALEGEGLESVVVRGEGKM